MERKIKMLFIFSVSLVVLIIAGFVISSLMIGGLFNPPITKDEVQELFVEDYDKLSNVAKFIGASQYDNVYIVEENDIADLSVSENEVVADIKWLIKNGYDVISKEKNTVYFQRWSNLDAGRGVCYVVDDENPTIQFLTKYEKLSKENWFYYEEDFNEWKRENGD